MKSLPEENVIIQKSKFVFQIVVSENLGDKKVIVMRSGTKRYWRVADSFFCWWI